MIQPLLIMWSRRRWPLPFLVATSQLCVRFRFLSPEAGLADLPGMGPDALPRPDAVASVRYATKKENWWIEVKIIEGPDGLKPFDFPFDWPEDPKLMSEGEIWSIVLTADWRGSVVAVESWWEKSE